MKLALAKGWAHPPHPLTVQPLAETQRNLLVAKAEYEGGHAVWECSYDLCTYIRNANLQDTLLTQPTLRVLELGCGKATPSAEVLSCRGALRTEIYCQEFNLDVLTATTAETFRGVTGDSSDVVLVQCAWSDMLSSEEPTEAERFDLILSSETTYRPENFGDLAAILKRYLKPQGQAWFAQKRFYFGLGGGSLPFMAYLANMKSLLCSIAERFEDGQSNVRDVLKITHADTAFEK